MVAGVSGRWTSPSILGDKTPNIDVILSPAYYEEVTTSFIPPASKTDAILKLVSTGAASDRPIGKQQEAIEEDIVTISREELDAKLAQNKAEVGAISGEMRREMAEFRAFQAQQFSTMNTAIGEIKSQISAVNGELTGLKGQIDGVKSSSSSIQWMVGVVLAVLALLLAIPQIQNYFKISDPQTQTQTQTQTQSPLQSDTKK